MGSMLHLITLTPEGVVVIIIEGFMHYNFINPERGGHIFLKAEKCL